MQNFITSLILFLATAVFGGLIAFVDRKRRGDPAADLAEQKKAEALIESVLFQYVTNAERNYGAGTGRLKLSAVVGWIVDFLPDKCKLMFSVDRLGDMAEAALRDAKERWKENPALIGKVEED